MRSGDTGSRIRDPGCGIRDAATLYPESRILHPDAGIPHPEVRRMRWRCRRGLLELDIVLERFVERYAELDETQRKVFDELLSLPDTALWDIISGKMPVASDDQRELLRVINAA